MGSTWNPVDQGVVLLEEDITWTWANGVEDSLDSGQYRILEYPVSSVKSIGLVRFYLHW